MLFYKSNYLSKLCIFFLRENDAMIKCISFCLLYCVNYNVFLNYDYSRENIFLEKQFYLVKNAYILISKYLIIHLNNIRFFFLNIENI